MRLTAAALEAKAMKRTLPLLTAAILFLSCSSVRTDSGSGSSASSVDESKAKNTVMRYHKELAEEGMYGQPVKDVTFSSFGPLIGNRASFMGRVNYSDPAVDAGRHQGIRGEALFERAQDGKWYLTQIDSHRLAPPLEVK